MAANRSRWMRLANTLRGFAAAGLPTCWLLISDGEIAGTYVLQIMEKLGSEARPPVLWRTWRCCPRVKGRESAAP